MKKDILVISSFPEKGHIHGEKTVGVASYTKNTLLGMLQAAQEQKENLSITVLAEKLQGQDSAYEDQEIQIKRVWKSNNIKSWINLLIQANKTPIKDIFIAFELAMFGGGFSLLFFLILLASLKLSRKKVTVISHHVITNLESVQGHINTKKGSIVNKLGTIVLKLFYQMIIFLAYKIVVFEQVLKDSLKNVNQNKIMVIPHGVEKTDMPFTPEIAREKLKIKNDEFLLVSFGYIAWYKGTDLLVNIVNQLPDQTEGRKIRLIIAGGPNPNRLEHTFYRSYIKNIQDIADKSNGKIQITGYVPEDQIALYYIASDCLIYPYRTIFSASGPLSLAFSYKKPFLIADSMIDIVKTEDFSEALSQEKVTADEIVFSLSSTSLQKAIKRLIATEYHKKFINISTFLSKTRGFTTIGKKYISLIAEK